MITQQFDRQAEKENIDNFISISKNKVITTNMSEIKEEYSGEYYKKSKKIRTIDNLFKY